jgi:hypothetical protein
MSWGETPPFGSTKSGQPSLLISPTAMFEQQLGGGIATITVGVWKVPSPLPKAIRLPYYQVDGARTIQVRRDK